MLWEPCCRADVLFVLYCTWFAFIEVKGNLESKHNSEQPPSCVAGEGDVDMRYNLPREREMNQVLCPHNGTSCCTKFHVKKALRAAEGFRRMVSVLAFGRVQEGNEADLRLQAILSGETRIHQ